MKRKTSSFIIGLFVTIGVILGATAIIWLSASKYFQKGTMYVTYFDESVQGLQVDSSVKYRGVDVGNVERIGVAPDNKLIEVVMKIALEGNVGKYAAAQLKAAGITGLVFIELDRQKDTDLAGSPETGFKTSYPVIPSRPSQFKQILSVFDEIVEKVRQVDFQGISDQLKKTTKAMETFITGPEIHNILVNLESVSAQLDSATRSVDSIIAEGKVDGILLEAKETIADTHSLVNSARDELLRMKLPEISEKADRLVEGLDRRSRAIAIEIKATSENLRRASETFDRFLERIQTTPSDLIFSRPPAAGDNE